jgi:hypothetical protein
VYFTSTFPPEYTGVQKIFDGWEQVGTSGYFIRHENSFELKAKYRKTNTMSILDMWVDIARTGEKGSGIFRYAGAFMRALHNLDVVQSDEWDIFDYGWTNPGHFRHYGYYQFVLTYTFYKRDQ